MWSLVAVARALLRPEAPIPLPEGRAAPAQSLFPRLAEVLRMPSFCLIVAASMAVAVSNWNFLNWLPLYFKETYRTGLAGAGFAGTFLHQGGGGLRREKLAGIGTGRALRHLEDSGAKHGEWDETNRGDQIRTGDLLLPRQAR